MKSGVVFSFTKFPSKRAGDSGEGMSENKITSAPMRAIISLAKGTF
jgi:hypothetical protein